METVDKGSIEIETLIEAPPNRVWQAWTSPEIIILWFGSDPGGIGISAELDVRPGGSFQVVFVDSDKTEHTCSGIYALVEELYRLHFTWAWKN